VVGPMSRWADQLQTQDKSLVFWGVPRLARMMPVPRGAKLGVHDLQVRGTLEGSMYMIGIGSVFRTAAGGRARAMALAIVWRRAVSWQQQQEKRDEVSLPRRVLL
jgi:hypothetical protein